MQMLGNMYVLICGGQRSSTDFIPHVIFTYSVSVCLCVCVCVYVSVCLCVSLYVVYICECVGLHPGIKVQKV